MELQSRYGDTWILEPTEEGYLWNLPGYTRFGLFPDSEDEIYFVDPPGGPFLEIGKEIFPGEIITEFRNQDSSNLLIKTYKKEG